ncbi:MAG: hypothetical protein ACI3YK_08000 [Eubacteriales bacterium]
MIQNRRRMAAFFASLTFIASLTGLLWTVAAENQPEDSSVETSTEETSESEESTSPVIGTQETEPVPATTEALSDTEAPIDSREPTVTGEPTVTEEPNLTEDPDVTEEPDLTEEPDVTEEPTQTEEPNITEQPPITDEPTVTDSSSTGSDEPVTTPDIGTSATTPEIPPVTTDTPQTEEVTTTTIGPSTDPVISTDAPTSQPPISLSTDTYSQAQTEAKTTTIGRQDSLPGTEDSVLRTDESDTPTVSGNSSSDNRANESKIGVIAVICSVLALISGLILAVLKFIH